MRKDEVRKMFRTIMENVQQKTPLIHCVTNYVTVNDVANMLLACGGSPIMADDISEAAEMTGICNGLVINIGTLNSRTIDSMISAGKRANALGHPVVLDPVGAGASLLRTSTVFRLLDEVKFSVIRGNISEIKTIYKGSGSTKGVDADISDAVTKENLPEAIRFANELSKRTGAVIVITGAIDIIVNGTKSFVIENGHPMMSKITGTGCMLTGVIAAYCAANPEMIWEAAACAVCAMGLCGEIAYEKVNQTGGGTSSYRMYLIDAMSKLDADSLERGKKIESR
jgi:hydroxyethylthiazole kinase